LLTFEKTGKLITFILVCVGFFIANAGYKQEVENFRIYSDPEDSLIVNQLAVFVNQCRSKYDQFFDYSYEQEVAIYLANSEQEYEKFNRPDIPSWSSGVAYTRLRKIILKPGSYYDPERYRETLFHEIAHMYIADISHNRSIPVWLNEGLSMYLSEKKISWQESIAIGNALSMGNLIELASIDSVLLFMNIQAELAYLQSFLAVQFLISKIGEDNVARMIHDFSLLNTEDDIFEKYLGYSYFEFEIDWYNDLKSRFKWMSWLQFENLFWIGLILIIFLAFLLKKIRNRKILKKWEREDYLDQEN